MKNKIRSSNRLKMTLFSLFAFLGLFLAQAQTKTISGTVNGDGLPLPGVAISVKGKTAGTITDFDGNYTIEAITGDVLTFSYTGFTEASRTIGEASTIDVDLVVEVSTLEEVVLVGYQKQKKSELTGAISSVKGEELEKQAVGNFAEALQGQVAGVNVQASSGAPGSKINVQIRGANSLSTSDSQDTNPLAGLDNPLGNSTGPLWVVDGVPLQRDPNLSPSEIQSVEVLKDAASTAIYGVRASSGVILVTTKRGKKGKGKIEFNTYTSINKITSKVPVLNTREAILVDFNFVNNNLFLGDFGSSGVFARNPNAADFQTDWQDFVQNDNAITKNYNVRFSGASEDFNYSLNLDYFDQDGVFIKTSNKRTNLRLNSGFKKGKFNMFASVNLSNSDIDLEPWRLLYGAISTQPYEPNPLNVSQIEGTDGSNNRALQGNLFSALQQTNKRDQFSAGAYVSFAYNWFKGFSTKLNLNANTFQIADKFFEPELRFVNTETGKLTNRRSSSLRDRNGVGNNGSWEFLAEYNNTFSKDHKLSLLAGTTRENKTWTQKNVTIIDGFPDNVFPTRNRSSNRNEAATSETISPQKLISYLGTLGYGYKEKYLLRSNVRYDGSANFSEGNRFDVFYGGSVGWVVSKEGFFQNSDALSFISNLKLRASYGRVGNQNLNSPFETSAQAVVGSNTATDSGRIISQLGNSNLSWETSVSRNLGLDLELYNGAVTFTGELYDVTKEDLLFATNLPLSVGVNPGNNNGPSTILTNIGELTNKGIELSAGYKDIRGDFKWGVNGTFTKNINEITSLGQDASELQGGPVTPGDNRISNDPVTFGRVGESIGSFYLLKTDGLIRNQEELDEYKNLGGEATNAVIGDLRYVDSDGDGEINLDKDRVFMGAGIPDFEVGLNYNMSYKNFDFNMQWFASFGSKVYNGPKALAYDAQTHRDLLYSFNPGTNENSVIPINRGDERSLNYSPLSDLFLEDGDYVRLRNVQLGFSLPNETIKKLGLTKMRIYLAGSNLLTITDYTGFDPEVGGGGLLSRGIDRGFTPVTGSGRIGVQLTF